MDAQNEGPASSPLPGSERIPRLDLDAPISAATELPGDGADASPAQQAADLDRENAALRPEAALQASEARLKEAQAIAHVGNWELDLVSNVLNWSDEIYRIFEIDPARFGRPTQRSWRRSIPTIARQ